MSETSTLNTAGLDGKIGSAPTSSSGTIETSATSVDTATHRTATNLETLDEPVSATIGRDLYLVYIKTRHVLLPTNDGSNIAELRQWDLWGPLILCLVLAMSLSATASREQAASVFTIVFVIVWVGAAFVTLNAALLGGHLSFLQSVCVLGYCIAPLCIASLVCHLVPWSSLRALKFVIVAVAFVWSTRASVGFMGAMLSDDRRALGVYPVLLFYFAISWLILMQ